MLDDLARELCRATRPGCEAEGYADQYGHRLDCDGVLQWAHIESRNHYGERWEPSGCFKLCAAHHRYWTSRRPAWDRFCTWMLGPGGFALVKRQAEFVKPDRERTLLDLNLALANFVRHGDVWVNPLVLPESKRAFS